MSECVDTCSHIVYYTPCTTLPILHSLYCTPYTTLPILHSLYYTPYTFTTTIYCRNVQTQMMIINSFCIEAMSSGLCRVCPTYPKVFVVPHSIVDEELRLVADFRMSGRVPTVVWR